MRIALLSTSDTDLLSRAGAPAPTTSWPTRPGVHESIGRGDRGLRPRRRPAPRLAAGPVAGLHPGRRDRHARSWCSAASRRPSAELMELSSVPIGVAAEAHRYLAEGGPGEPPPAARLPLRHGAAHRRGLRAAGRRSRPGGAPRAAGASDERDLPRDRGALLPRPRGQRQHRLRARPRRRVDATGAGGRRTRSSRARCAPRPTSSTTRSAPSTRSIVTVLAAGGSVPSTASAGGDDEAWDVERMAALDIPVLQGLCLTSSRAEWEASDDGVTPARLRDPDRDPGVRRPDHHRAVLLQGDRRRRAAALRRRPRALRPRRRDRGQARPAARDPQRRARSSRSCSRPTPPSTPASATRSASTPRSPRSGCCAGCATRATTSAPTTPVVEHPRRSGDRHRGRRRADPRADRRPAARTRSG